MRETIQFRAEAQCERCEYPDGGCYRDGSCRRYFRLDRPAPQRFRVPIYPDLDVAPTYELASPIIDAAAVFREVILARPLIPNLKRTDLRVADQWISMAAQEAREHANICTPSGCICSNCQEYQQVRTRALELFDKGFVSGLSEAWHAAMDETTGGVGNSLWMRPRNEPKTTRDMLPQSTYVAMKTKVVTVSTPDVKEGSWVEKRFGVLDV